MTAVEVAARIAAASSWDERVALVRKIPEDFGMASQAEIYSAVAKAVYAPTLAPDFAYVHWRDEYELPTVEAAYNDAVEMTAGFTRVSAEDLARTIEARPRALRVFRLVLGFTTAELEAACGLVAEEHGAEPVSKSQIQRLESGGSARGGAAATCGLTIAMAMEGTLFPAAPSDGPLRLKLAKPDTLDGWDSLRRFAQDGVPLPVFLHQRAYGGAFRQLLDATSSARGDALEDAVEAVLVAARIPHYRTGSKNQEVVAEKFGLTVRPAPDFVIYDNRGDILRAMLECKQVSDGGTARDKAARFNTLRGEGVRLGGIPVFAVLSGIGWRRAGDALGPVVRDTDGRVFTPSNLRELVTTEPLPGLQGLATPREAEGS